MRTQQRAAEAVDSTDASSLDLGPALGPKGALRAAGCTRALFERVAHARTHLTGSFIGERDRQHLGGVVVLQQPDIALDQHAGLAAAGASHDDKIDAIGGDRPVLRVGETHLRMKIGHCGAIVSVV